MSLYTKYRPKLLKHVVGQDDALDVIKGLFKKQFPQASLFTGPSGCGKTTLARICATKLDCGKHDLQEINCADFRGIDTVREIRQRINLSPVSGSCRVWVIDESHRLTGDAQDALLKILEEPRKNRYFMLATTEPKKLRDTIRTRCTEIKVSSLTNEDLNGLLETVCEKEGIKLSEEVQSEISECSQGSARKALVLLEQVADIDDEEAQLRVIRNTDLNKQAIEIARALFKPKPQWKEVAKIVKAVDDDPEGIRHLILAYATSILLGGGALSTKAYLIITCFSDHFMDSKKAGLVAACYEACNAK